MFVVLYRWRIKAGFGEQFKEGWSEVTKYYLENFDSLGSRLHRGDDGLYYAYAQWESAEQREKAFFDSALNSASEKMRQAIEESFPEVTLEVIADFLKKAE